MADQNSYWDYRVIEFNVGEDRWWAIHEVYYEDGKPNGYSSSLAPVLWDEDDLDIARDILYKMIEATDKPILKESDFYI